MSQLFTLQNVPIFQVGSWNGDVYHEADLDAMAQAYGQVGFKPPLKLGHDESQPLAKSDGMPALGWVANLKRVGKILYADLINLPKQIYDLIQRKAYNRVSAEVYWDYEEGGRRLPRVLKAVALLGAEIPAVTSLAALEALYDASGKPFKRYDMPMPMGGMRPPTAANPATEIASYEPAGPKKYKEDVSYQPAAEGGYERCGACRFFEGPIDATGEDERVGNCVLVEGEIASTFVCNLLEVRDAFTAASATRRSRRYAGGNGMEEKPGELKTYTIEKRGDKWCLIAKSTGETLGCHPTEAEAQAQERAVQASKSAAQEQVAVRLTQDEMRKVCPACADHMRFLNLREYKITYDPAAKTYAGFSQGLCDKFSPGEGFRTRCMDSSLGAGADDPGALCNSLETWCFDNGYLASKTAQAQLAKVHGAGAHSKEDSEMADKRYAEMTVEKQGDEYCVMQGGEKVVCKPTMAMAQAEMDRMAAEGDGGKTILADLRAKVDTLTQALEAKTALATTALAASEAKLKEYEKQIADSEAEKVKLADEKLQGENKAWLDGLSVADRLRLLPAERPYVAFLLDAITAAPALKSYVRTYRKKDGDKEQDVTETLPAVAVFKRLFEMREPNTVLFREISDGRSTGEAGKAPIPEGMAAAREAATQRARTYQSEQLAKGIKVDFKSAFTHVLSQDAELKEAVAGVRPEGAAKAAEGARHYGRMVGARATTD